MEGLAFHAERLERKNFALNHGTNTLTAEWMTAPIVPLLRVTTLDSFKNLDVWNEAMTLVQEVYLISRVFPQDERFGLTAQLRRAAVSIPSNIGEGARRRSRNAFIHHLDIALGSQGEVDVQVDLATRLGYCPTESHRHIQERIDRIGRMLNGLIASLRSRGV